MFYPWQPRATSLRATCSSTSERSWTTAAPASRHSLPSRDSSDVNDVLDGCTPLLELCYTNIQSDAEQTACADLLIAAGADVNARCDGITNGGLFVSATPRRAFFCKSQAARGLWRGPLCTGPRVRETRQR